MHLSRTSFLQLTEYGTVCLLMSSCVPPVRRSSLDWRASHWHSSQHRNMARRAVLFYGQFGLSHHQLFAALMHSSNYVQSDWWQQITYLLSSIHPLILHRTSQLEFLRSMRLWLITCIPGRLCQVTLSSALLTAKFYLQAWALEQMLPNKITGVASNASCYPEA